MPRSARMSGSSSTGRTRSRPSRWGQALRCTSAPAVAPATHDQCHPALHIRPLYPHLLPHWQLLRQHSLHPSTAGSTQNPSETRCDCTPASHATTPADACLPACHLPQALRAALLAEAEASARYNAEVASRWAALYDVEVPQELYEQTERQQQLCCRVIANKQDLIAGGDCTRCRGLVR